MRTSSGVPAFEGKRTSTCSQRCSGAGTETVYSMAAGWAEAVATEARRANARRTGREGNRRTDMSIG